jgi:hypothetical protein
VTVVPGGAKGAPASSPARAARTAEIQQRHKDDSVNWGKVIEKAGIEQK